MTPEQKIIAIAEFEFWSMRQPYSGEYQIGKFTEEWTSDQGFPKELPEKHSLEPYLTSRDAICGAVARLDEKQRRIFANMLYDIQLGCDDHSCWYPKTITISVDDVANLILATPAQLADALLLTLGHEI